MLNSWLKNTWTCSYRLNQAPRAPRNSHSRSGHNSRSTPKQGGFIRYERIANDKTEAIRWHVENRAACTRLRKGSDVCPAPPDEEEGDQDGR
jgi:hypothetical protein